MTRSARRSCTSVGSGRGDTPGAELEFGLLAGLLAVALLGPGRPSVDHAIGIEAGTPTLVEQGATAHA